MSAVLWCFYNDGSEAEDNVPCNPDGNHSACCGPGWECVNNLYCRDAEGITEAPGTCTDEYWKSPACPCPSHVPNGGGPLNYRDGTTTCGTDGFICGPYQEALCDNSTGKVMPIVDYGNTNLVPEDFSDSWTTYYEGQVVWTAPLYSTTSSAITSSMSEESSTSAPTSTSIALSTSPGNSTLVVATTPTFSSAATTTESRLAEDEGLSSSTKAGIGVAAGISIPLVLALLLVAFCLRRRSKKSRSSPMQSPSNPHSRSAMMAAPELKDNTYKSDPPSMLLEASSLREARELPGTDIERLQDVERRTEG